MLRPIVIAQFAKTGDKTIVEEARKKFAEFQQNPSSLPADLRFIVYKVCACVYLFVSLLICLVVCLFVLFIFSY
jgi:hypothetical protein